MKNIFFFLENFFFGNFQNFVKSLNEVNTFKAEGNELKFYKDGILELIFEKK